MAPGMTGPGFLAVAVQPGATTSLPAFHTWYNTEHGPLRLRLPFVTSGDRYLAHDGRTPQWYAIYDVSDLAHLSQRIYTRLREERSVREKNVMGTLESLDRKIYSLVSSSGDVGGTAAEFVVAVSMQVRDERGEEVEGLVRRQREGLQKIKGWKRSRWFKMVVGGIEGMPESGVTEFLEVHEFGDEGGLGSGGYEGVTGEVWTQEALGRLEWRSERVWKYYLTFDKLQEEPSTVLTTDAASLRWRMEGDASDPVVVCVNSIMTKLEMWDGVARALREGVGGKRYRVLRYDARGYAQQDEKSNPTSFGLLADDLEYLLQRMGVDKVHAVLGVSMGGVTAINFAIRHPDMLEKYVACDCNVASSAANSQAWAERVDLAKTKGMAELAKVTVERWFTPANHGSAEVERVREMAAESNLEGFRLNSLALSDYDLKPRLAEIKVPGLLIAGDGDGKIPEAMQKFGIPNTTFRSIPNAGHLPFLENHEVFVEALASFL